MYWPEPISHSVAGVRLPSRNHDEGTSDEHSTHRVEHVSRAGHDRRRRSARETTTSLTGYAGGLERKQALVELDGPASAVAGHLF